MYITYHIYTGIHKFYCMQLIGKDSSLEDIDLLKNAAHDRRHDALPTTSQPQNLTAGETSEQMQCTHYCPSRGAAHRVDLPSQTLPASLFSFFFAFAQTKLSSAPLLRFESHPPARVTLSCSVLQHQCNTTSRVGGPQNKHV